LLLGLGALVSVHAFDAGKAGFHLRYKEETSPYKVTRYSSCPARPWKCGVLGEETGRFAMKADTREGPSRWPRRDRRAARLEMESPGLGGIVPALRLS